MVGNALLLPLGGRGSHHPPTIRSILGRVVGTSRYRSIGPPLLFLLASHSVYQASPSLSPGAVAVSRDCLSRVSAVSQAPSPGPSAELRGGGAASAGNTSRPCNRTSKQNGAL